MKNQNVKDKVADLWRHILWSMDNSDEYYSDADKRWLSRNIALVIVFFEAADRYRSRGKKISQRFIAHELRAYTDANDDSNYKILNAGVTLMAHVYNDRLKSKYFTTYGRVPFGVSECKS